MRAVPPAKDPVNATALIAGCFTSWTPTSTPAVEEHGEDAFRKAARLHALANGLADQRAGPGMRRVRLDDDGIARGECGSGVSTGHGKGQREIAGAENSHRAQRLMHGTDGRLGQRLAVGVGIVDARVHPGTFFHYFGEESQLAAGSPHLAGQAGLGDRCFQIGPLDDGRRGCLDGGCDLAQKCAFVLA